MKRLSYIFFGTTHFSKAILENLLQKGYLPKAIFSIPEYFSISYAQEKVKNCNFFDFSSLAREYNIPFYWVESPTNTLLSYKDKIQEYEVDFFLVANWYYKIPYQIYTLSKMGAFGFHNSLLPKYAGSAPLVWAMIKGERESGVTLFKMNEEMDCGDIISQESFVIDFKDSINEVLKKAEKIAIQMSLDLFCKPIVFTEQKGETKYYPPRNPEDGEIDLNLSAEDLYNFIRAQSFPYPGAFIKTRDGKRLIIEKAYIDSRIPNNPSFDNPAGGGGRFSRFFAPLQTTSKKVA
ncbi:methionyl-tRNA formyltransferase [Helicobacter sp. MIT 11-5569]|uniref:methionyl-tRNA formyltransferase n=1 Tax=Helicobacter sp. MIT 11-5569 TaxID=1548151 RepID=UPI0010FD9FFF|nr:formyltransferase family protein [Helicobacter sp. MIT 11-5569]TLD84590.1 methionyl-tRNA formyltransferase [Helicobacter sp. MIT 11-5569]